MACETQCCFSVKNTLRRNGAGHSAILLLMEEIFDIDAGKFASAPVFADDGSCRMKFEGASKITRKEMYDISPKVMECLAGKSCCKT